MTKRPPMQKPIAPDVGAGVQRVQQRADVGDDQVVGQRRPSPLRIALAVVGAEGHARRRGGGRARARARGSPRRPAGRRSPAAPRSRPGRASAPAPAGRPASPRACTVIGPSAVVTRIVVACVSVTSLLQPFVDQHPRDGQRRRQDRPPVGQLVAPEPAHVLQLPVAAVRARRRRSGSGTRASARPGTATAARSGSATSSTATADSSCTSRATASSSDSPGSTKPARHE